MPIYNTGKSKDGKTQYRVFVSYTDINGKHCQKTKTVYGKAEASLLEMKMQADAASEPVSCKSMTVQQLFDEYVEAKKGDVRASSLNKSISILKNHILPALGEEKLKSINVRTLQAWKNGIAAKNLSLTMSNNIYTELRTMLNFAVKMEYLPKNPLQAVGSFKDGAAVPADEPIHYYTAEQFRAFIEVAKRHRDTLAGLGFYVFFNIAFLTGARKGEINALKWSDVSGNILNIHRSVNQKEKGQEVVETLPKNKTSYRSLQMPQNLIEILNEHKEYVKKYDKNFTEDYRICGGANVLKDSTLSKINFQYAAEAGLPHIRIHDFRHSHASVLINEGISIQEITRRLGHSNVEITWKTYAHLYPREEERAVRILENL